jgi:hypothetical protein
MKVSKIELGKTVENRKLLLTPKYRKQISRLVKNVENLFDSIIEVIKLNYVNKRLT